MKKSLLALCILACASFAGEIAYSNVVKSVYLDNTKSKVAGRLLPTNAIEILDQNASLVKFQIKGYQNPASPNVIYYSDGVRILSLAFAKTAKPDIKVQKKSVDGKWNEISVIAYADAGNFESSVEPMFKKAGELYSQNCSICHALHDINQYTANQWPALFRSMASRTPIEKSDHWSVIEYLQKHTNKQ